VVPGRPRHVFTSRWAGSSTTPCGSASWSLPEPIYFFTGRYDYNSPFEEAERYYRALDASRGKHFIWFENAAHMIPYEAPDEYADALIHRVLKETREN
jgi:pimeloyl-ACP methyl ester carboxylesterase